MAQHIECTGELVHRKMWSYSNCKMVGDRHCATRINQVSEADLIERNDKRALNCINMQNVREWKKIEKVSHNVNKFRFCDKAHENFSQVLQSQTNDMTIPHSPPFQVIQDQHHDNLIPTHFYNTAASTTDENSRALRRTKWSVHGRVTYTPHVWNSRKLINGDNHESVRQNCDNIDVPPEKHLQCYCKPSEQQSVTVTPDKVKYDIDKTIDLESPPILPPSQSQQLYSAIQSDTIPSYQQLDISCCNELSLSPLKQSHRLPCSRLINNPSGPRFLPQMVSESQTNSQNGLQSSMLQTPAVLNVCPPCTREPLETTSRYCDPLHYADSIHGNPENVAYSKLGTLNVDTDSQLMTSINRSVPEIQNVELLTKPRADSAESISHGLHFVESRVVGALSPVVKDIYHCNRTNHLKPVNTVVPLEPNIAVSDTSNENHCMNRLGTRGGAITIVIGNNSRRNSVRHSQLNKLNKISPESRDKLASVMKTLVSHQKTGNQKTTVTVNQHEDIISHSEQPTAVVPKCERNARLKLFDYSPHFEMQDIQDNNLQNVILQTNGKNAAEIYVPQTSTSVKDTASMSSQHEKFPTPSLSVGKTDILMDIERLAAKLDYMQAKCQEKASRMSSVLAEGIKLEKELNDQVNLNVQRTVMDLNEQNHQIKVNSNDSKNLTSLSFSNSVTKTSEEVNTDHDDVKTNPTIAWKVEGYCNDAVVHNGLTQNNRVLTPSTSIHKMKFCPINEENDTRPISLQIMPNSSASGILQCGDDDTALCKLSAISEENCEIKISHQEVISCPSSPTVQSSLSLASNSSKSCSIKTRQKKRRSKKYRDQKTPRYSCRFNHVTPESDMDVELRSYEINRMQQAASGKFQKDRCALKLRKRRCSIDKLLKVYLHEASSSDVEINGLL